MSIINPLQAADAPWLRPWTRQSVRRTKRLMELLVDLALSTNPPAHYRQLLSGMPSSSVAAICELAVDEQVFLPVAAALMVGGREDAVPALMRSHFAKLHAFRLELAALTAQIAYLCSSQQLEIAFAKGFGYEQAYGPGYLRQFGDLDPVVADIATFWKIVALFGLADIRLRQVLLRRNPADGQVTGNASFVAPSQVYPQLGRLLDMHIGAQPLTAHSYCEYDSSFWQERRRLTLHGRPTPTPSIRWSLGILLGESLERTGLRLRDLLDFVALLEQATGADIEWLIVQAKLHGLTGQLHRFVTACHACSSLRPRVPNWLSERVAGSRPLAPGRPGSVFAHTFAYQRRHGSGRLAAISAAVAAAGQMQAAAWGKMTWFQRSIAAWSDRTNPQQEYCSGRNVQFLPVAYDLKGDLDWVGAGLDALLLTPIGALMPAPCGIATEARIAGMMRYRKELRSEAAAHLRR